VDAEGVPRLKAKRLFWLQLLHVLRLEGWRA
jgi:hypothetical protein